MSIGTGIAIAGAWVFAGLVAHSKTTTGFGMLLAIAVAGIVTVTLALSDQAGPVKSIDVAFAIPVNITRAQERRLHELLDDIVSHPSNQLVEGIHWVSAYGGKMLWREPEEPEVDMTVMAVETTARPFVSDRERERTLKEREEIWK